MLVCGVVWVFVGCVGCVGVAWGCVCVWWIVWGFVCGGNKTHFFIFLAINEIKTRIVVARWLWCCNVAII